VSQQRLDVKQAAQALGISSEGVRKRIKRGTLESEKAHDGKVFVWLDGTDEDRTNSPTGSDNGSHINGDSDRTEYGQRSDPQTDALHSSLQDQVSYLRNQLDLEREANRENRRLLAAALERIPEIEAPRELSTPKPPQRRETPPRRPRKTLGMVIHPPAPRSLHSGPSVVGGVGSSASTIGGVGSREISSPAALIASTLISRRVVSKCW
jgi:hypothetical protein